MKQLPAPGDKVYVLKRHFDRVYVGTVAYETYGLDHRTRAVAVDVPESASLVMAVAAELELVANPAREV